MAVVGISSFLGWNSLSFFFFAFLSKHTKLELSHPTLHLLFILKSNQNMESLLSSFVEKMRKTVVIFYI